MGPNVTGLVSLLGLSELPPIWHSYALPRQGYGALRAHMGPGGVSMML